MKQHTVFKSLPIMAIIAILLFLSACSTIRYSPNKTAGEQEDSNKEVSVQALSSVLPHLTRYRAVLIGEQHDRYDHHNAQLDVIKFLYEHDRNLVVGLEFIQQPFQSILDDFVQSKITENEMLRHTEYFTRWRYDYRLYAPIFRFAQENSIRLVALNLPSEIVRQTARKGLESLNKEQKKQIPLNIQHDVPGYRERIEYTLTQHGDAFKPDIENFIAAQLLWDEGMAERAAEYLQNHVTDKMVILAGAGHIIDRTGIPTRLERRLHSPVAAVINTIKLEDAYNGMGDFIIHTERSELPAKGQIGIFMGIDEKGVKVNSFAEGSAAEAQGVKIGDYLRSISKQKIESFSDVSLHMWDKSVEDVVELRIDRYSGDSVNPISFTITLK